MPRQYKLRLGDGTMLAVDQDGLSGWLIDEMAMVQPAGSRRWHPLKEVVARAAAAARAEAAALKKAQRDAAAPPASAEPAAVPSPAPPEAPAIVATLAEPPAPTPLPLVPPPPRQARVPPAPGPTPTPLPLVPPPPRRTNVQVPEPPPVAEPAPIALASLAPLEEAPASPLATVNLDDLPIIPFKPIEKPAPVPPPAAVPRVPEPPPVRQARVEDDLPIIPFKPIDEEEDLEELDLLEEERAPKPSRSGALLDAVSSWARKRTAPAPPSAVPPREEPPPPPPRSWAPPPAASSSASREPLKPPPPVSERPTLRFAPLAKERDEEDVYDSGRWRLWLRRGVLAVIGVGAAGAAIATRQTWMPQVEKLGPSLFQAIDERARPLSASPLAAPSPGPLPKELQDALAQLPHLSPETVRLLASTSESGVTEAPEIFRRAYAAARRGMAVLSPAEARELMALEAAVVAALRPAERARVRAYDRLSAGRNLMTAEDGRVLGLFARGARALPAARRERLQELLAKAIAASPPS